MGAREYWDRMLVYFGIAEEAYEEDDGWADGMGLIRVIASNARLFTDSSTALPGQISGGDVVLDRGEPTGALPGRLLRAGRDVQVRSASR